MHRDHHVVFEGSFYSMPTKYIGQTIWIRASERLVEIYQEHSRVKVHPRSSTKGVWVTDPQDYPPQARAFFDQDKDQCLIKAHQIGTSSHTFLKKVLRQPTLVNRRKAQAILRLSDRYGPTRLEDACQRALSFGNLSYRCLKRILSQDIEAGSSSAIQTKRCLSKESSYLRLPHEFVTFPQEALS